jgi:hypothetical protein
MSIQFGDQDFAGLGRSVAGIVPAEVEPVDFPREGFHVVPSMWFKPGLATGKRQTDD